MFKVLILLFFSFMAGFLLHALVFPDLLSNGILFPSARSILSNDISPTPSRQKPPDQAVYTVTFDGERFSRTNLTVPFSRYLAILNDSQDRLMLLLSNQKGLTTPRGYGYKEEVRVRQDTKGQFTVQEKNSGATMVITVK